VGGLAVGKLRGIYNKVLHLENSFKEVRDRYGKDKVLFLTNLCGIRIDNLEVLEKNHLQKVYELKNLVRQMNKNEAELSIEELNQIITRLDGIELFLRRIVSKEIRLAELYPFGVCAVQDLDEIVGGVSQRLIADDFFQNYWGFCGLKREQVYGETNGILPNRMYLGFSLNDQAVTDLRPATNVFSFDIFQLFSATQTASDCKKERTDTKVVKARRDILKELVLKVEKSSLAWRFVICMTDKDKFTGLPADKFIEPNIKLGWNEVIGEQVISVLVAE
jgi:hypothetical protein